MSRRNSICNILLIQHWLPLYNQPPLISPSMNVPVEDILVLIVLRIFSISPLQNQISTKQCLTTFARCIQMTHTTSIPNSLTGIALWTNNQWKQTIFLLIFMPHNHFQNCLRCCGESPFRLQKTFAVGSFHDLAPKYLPTNLHNILKKRHMFDLSLNRHFAI